LRDRNGQKEIGCEWQKVNQHKKVHAENMLLVGSSITGIIYIKSELFDVAKCNLGIVKF